MPEQVTLRFEDETVYCDKIEVVAHRVREGDFVFCPFEGLVHVHKVEQRGALVELHDCESQAHLYHERTALHVARPSIQRIGR